MFNLAPPPPPRFWASRVSATTKTLLAAVVALALIPIDAVQAQSGNAWVWLEQSTTLIRGCGRDEAIVHIRAGSRFFRTKVRLVVLDGDAGDLEAYINGSWATLSGGLSIEVGSAGKDLRVRAKNGAAIGGATTREENALGQYTLTFGPQDTRKYILGLERFALALESEPMGDHRRDFNISGSPILGSATPSAIRNRYGIRFYVVNYNHKFPSSLPKQPSGCTTAP